MKSNTEIALACLAFGITNVKESGFGDFGFRPVKHGLMAKKLLKGHMVFPKTVRALIRKLLTEQDSELVKELFQLKEETLLLLQSKEKHKSKNSRVLTRKAAKMFNQANSSVMTVIAQKLKEAPDLQERAPTRRSKKRGKR